MPDNFKNGHYARGTAAGAKGNSKEAKENSEAAAAEVTKGLGRRHAQMVEAWTPYGAEGAIPEVIAEDIGLPVHVVRPRAGELKKRGLFFEVGKRMGQLGQKVTVYSTVKPNQDCERAA